MNAQALSWVDHVVLSAFHWTAVVLLGLICAYYVTDWAWRLLEAIYKRIWRLEYLVRTAQHCARQTYLRPPSCYYVDGKGIPQKRDQDGEWYQPEPGDDE